MAVLIPSLLPPPMPFKIFVLLAGAAGISTGRFAVAIVIGRGIRYFGEALLAVWYGDQAMEFLHANGRTASLSAGGAHGSRPWRVPAVAEDANGWSTVNLYSPR